MTQMLPYIEEQATYDLFDFTVQINGNLATNVRNQQAEGRALVLLCPSDGFNQVLYAGNIVAHGDNWGRTNYAANAGGAFIYYGSSAGACGTATDYICTQGPTGTAWKNGKDGWKDNNRRRGVMGPNTSVSSRQITDGMSKTIMVGEIRSGLTEKDGRGVWALGHAGASLLSMYGSGGDANGPNACFPASDDVYSDVCGLPIAQAECMTCDAGYFAQGGVRSSHVGGAFWRSAMAV